MTIETRPTEVAPQTKTVADVLRHAARIIEERGWEQGRLSHPDGRVCALGAITLAGAGRIGISNMSVAGALLAIDKMLGRSVPGWNDEHGRTPSEVTAALRAAADKWEAEQR